MGMLTGIEELQTEVSCMQVLNTVGGLLPFLPADDAVPKEETRLRYRTLDLRCAASDHQLLHLYGVLSTIYTSVTASGNLCNTRHPDGGCLTLQANFDCMF